MCVKRAEHTKPRGAIHSGYWGGGAGQGGGGEVQGLLLGWWWKYFATRQRWWLYSTGNVLNAAELSTLKSLISSYVNFTLIKKKTSKDCSYKEAPNLSFGLSRPLSGHVSSPNTPTKHSLFMPTQNTTPKRYLVGAVQTQSS